MAATLAVAAVIGLMLMLVTLGVMSVTWMAVIAAVIAAQKLLPTKAAIDVALGLAIVGFGIPDHDRALVRARTHATADVIRRDDEYDNT